MAQVLITVAAICSKYRISQEQFDKATYCITNGQGYYVVESQSEAGKEYQVRYNRQYNALSCTCKAGEHGTPCWHKRAALANQEHYKATQAARRQSEQAEVESTQAYQFEQAIHDFEVAMSDFDQYTAEFNQIMQAAGILV